MTTTTSGAVAPKILVVGGGYAGFYTAKKLESLFAKFNKVNPYVARDPSCAHLLIFSSEISKFMPVIFLLQHYYRNFQLIWHGAINYYFP